MPPRRGLRFFGIGSTKIPLLTELKMMNAIPADDFTHNVFLSHSSKDKAGVCAFSLSASIGERAEVRCRSLRLLRADGLRVWFDDREIRTGDSIPTKIEEGLNRSRVLTKDASLSAVMDADLKSPKRSASILAQQSMLNHPVPN